MKKTIVFALLMVGSAAFAVDSYLYWMVADDASGVADGTYTTKVAYQTGSTWAWNNSTYLTLADSAGTAISGPVSSKIGSGAENMAYYSSVNGLGNTVTFFIELWNGENLVGVSEGLGYSSAGIGALEGMGTPATLNMFTNFGAAPIPEPNSGLLMLIGASVLALRRKKLQKKA